MEAETDRGQHRFKVFTDPAGIVWVKSVSRNERRAARRGLPNRQEVGEGQ